MSAPFGDERSAAVRPAAVQPAADAKRAREGASLVLRYLVSLYTMGGETSSLAAEELARLARSMLYVLGVDSPEDPSAVAVLARPDAVRAYEERRRALDERARATVALWHKVALALPQIPNRPLMDTMEAVREAPARYDTHFSAHIVPAEFLYVPHGFDARGLAGIDAVEAWLQAMLAEARWLARFDTESLARTLEAHALGYLDDCTSLRDLAEPYAAELAPARRDGVR